MRHDEFRDRLQDALRGTGLLLQHAGLPSETMDLASASRRWEAYIRQPASQNSERVPISAKVTLEWDPINAARVNVRGKVSSPNLSGENREIRKPSCGGRASISGCMPRFPTATRLQCRTCRSSALGQAPLARNLTNCSWNLKSAKGGSWPSRAAGQKSPPKFAVVPAAPYSSRASRSRV